MSSKTMAKKTQRCVSGNEGDHLGCVWGFISMFNLRHGRYAHKLLVDRRHGSKCVSGDPRNNKLDKPEFCEEASRETLVEEGRNMRIAVIKPSVKKLIEEELFIDKEIKEKDNRETGQVSDSELEGRRRKKNRTRGKSCDSFGHMNAIENPRFEGHRSNLNYHQSMTSLDIDDVIEEFCCEIHRRNASHLKNKKLNKNRQDYKERLRELVKFLISQKLVHGNRPREDSEILTSKDLMEVYQILGSDEDLFLKLLQDPDLLVPRDVQDLRFGENEIDEENTLEQSRSPAGRKQSSIFRMKNRAQERTDPNKCDSSDRIIILKAGPASLLSPEMGNSHCPSPEPHLMKNKAQSERSSSNFFLSEIKRKLRHAMRKDREGLPRDGGFGEGFQKTVPTKDHFFIERMAKPSMTEKNSATVLQKHEEDDKKQQRVSNIYIEAKKHLSEMLNNGDFDLNSTSKQVKRSLGRILSLPQYSSPLGSPRRRGEPSSPTAHRRSASADFLNFEGNEKESHESSPGHAMENADLQLCPSNNSDSCTESLQPAPRELTEDSVNKADGIHIKDTISSDDVIIVKEVELTPAEDDAISNALSDQGSPFMLERNRIVDGNSKEEDHNEQTSLEENQEAGSSSVDSLSNSLAKTEEPKSVPEWASPVSVLEPLFSEDDISPAKMRSQSGEALVQPLCIRFEENDCAAGNEENNLKTIKDDEDLVFNYVKAILESVELKWEELYLKSQSSDELLEPVLISNVPFCPNQLCSDHELLFDCINEVLLDFCSCPPWVSFYKPKTRVFSTVKSIIHEVQEAVYWRLVPLPLPRALDQIVRKDMAKAGNWLDIRDEIDCIGSEIGELILEELLEEVVLRLYEH